MVLNNFSIQNETLPIGLSEKTFISRLWNLIEITFMTMIFKTWKRKIIKTLLKSKMILAIILSRRKIKI